MKVERQSRDAGHREMLRDVLVRLRDATSERIKKLRRDQEQESEPPVADEMDIARSSSDIETHAELIALEENKLRLVDEALARLESGKYGICLECHQRIPFERMSAIPFAAYCVDCQDKRKRAGQDWVEGSLIPPFDQQWTLPAEMEEPADREYRTTGPEEELTIHFQEPSGSDETRKTTPDQVATRKFNEKAVTLVQGTTVRHTVKGRDRST